MKKFMKQKKTLLKNVLISDIFSYPKQFPVFPEEAEAFSLDS